MPSARTRVVVTRRLPQPVEARMQELFDVRLNTDDHAMTPEEIGAAMAEGAGSDPTTVELIAGRGPAFATLKACDHA